MFGDSEGFLFPEIDDEKCINCGLCEKKCPVLTPSVIDNRKGKQELYAAWHKNSAIRMKSSSGAIFSALAENILNANGKVYGAAFENNFLVHHIGVDDFKNLEALRGSKYVQSNIGKSYLEAKKDLHQEKSVLFSGTPCQIAGLYSFLGQDYKNLLTCSLICKGVPSPKVFKKYINYLEAKYKSQIISYSFRDKKYGWAPNEAIKFSNGLKMNSNYPKNKKPYYYYAFSQKNLFLRPCCYSCKFKGFLSNADITLGDYWSIKREKPSWNDEKGTSLVLVNSDKGETFFNSAKFFLTYHNIPLEQVYSNYNLYKSPKIPPQRRCFFYHLDHMSFEKLMNKYMKPPHPLICKIKNSSRNVKTTLKKLYRNLRD